MGNSLLFESLIHTLMNGESRKAHGQNSVLLMALLVQYRKYDSTNPFIVKLSILDDELALHGLSQVITSCFNAYNSNYELSLSDQPHSGWFSSITSMVGNMFVSDEMSARPDQQRACNYALLAFYEAVHLNRNFIATLGHYQTESTMEKSTHESVSSNNSETNGDQTPTTPVGHNPPSFPGSVVEEIKTPSNLLVTFLEYCSIAMQVNWSR